MTFSKNLPVLLSCRYKLEHDNSILYSLTFSLWELWKGKDTESSVQGPYGPNSMLQLKEIPDVIESHIYSIDTLAIVTGQPLFPRWWKGIPFQVPFIFGGKE